jgi:hypothetical protein
MLRDERGNVLHYMATNGSNNDVVMRDERGRYLKGMPGGPGRPAGSRNKLTEDFFADLHAAWQEHGREAIDRVVAERPEAFLAIVARTIDVRRVELGQPGEFDRVRTREEISQRLEERAGPAARKLFDQFVARLEKLERDYEEQVNEVGRNRWSALKRTTQPID